MLGERGPTDLFLIFSFAKGPRFYVQIQAGAFEAVAVWKQASGREGDCKLYRRNRNPLHKCEYMWCYMSEARYCYLILVTCHPFGPENVRKPGQKLAYEADHLRVR